MFGEIVGEFIDGFSKIVGGLIIAVILCSLVFGGAGYYFGNSHGKSVGYEQGAKDALAGKISWQQTIQRDSVLIIKK